MSGAAGCGLGAVLRLHVSVARAEAFEADVRRQVAEVDEHEPGTLVYGFYREGESGDRVTYLHTMAYADQAAQEEHWEREARWWWDAFSGYLGAPIESERFTDDALMRSWTSAGSRDGALLVALIDASEVDSLEALSSGAYGWMQRLVASDDPSVLPERSPGVLVVLSTADAERAARLAEELSVLGGSVRLGRRPIANLVRSGAGPDPDQEG